MKTAFVVPLLPSVTVTSSIESAGAASSLRMVPAPEASARLAPLAPERLTRKPSSGSATASPTTATVTVFVVSPGAKVRLPEAAA